MIIRRCVLFLMILILLSCSKEEVTSKTFSEKMIGKWELRERVDLLGDKSGNWFGLQEPYFMVSINADQTYSFSQREVIIEEGTYSISDSDSIVQFEFLKWIPTELTCNSFILVNVDIREGETKS